MLCINSGRCKDPFMQQCLRELVYLACRFEFQIRAVWIEGINNREADSLSRWHLHEKYKEVFFVMQVIGP